MNNKILIGSIIAVAMLILSSSVVIGKEKTIPENNVFVNNLNTNPILFRILIIAKISNLTHHGGFPNPHYKFHIDIGVTLSIFPVFRIRRDRNAVMGLDFWGFINDSFIFGISESLYIYHE